MLIGKNGQLGIELQRVLADAGAVVCGLGRAELDLADIAAIRSAVRTFAPAIIVNAAAYTAVDRAESEPEVARSINAIAPVVMAEEAAKRGAALVHYSTDYVFAGTATAPYTEEDATGPLSVYGSTKLAGEQGIRNSQARHVIFRASWIYSEHSKNFFRTVLRLSREREQLRIVSDQVGSPTWARHIAEATAAILARESLSAYPPFELSSGVYHMTAAGLTSWHGFATEIVSLCRQRLGDQRCEFAVKDIVPIASADFPLPARRPKYSVLANNKLADVFGVQLPCWREQLAGLIECLHSSQNTNAISGLHL
ncbi:MAG TPA: dTDP-4-dehydrorhamnose reductase [Clostridia bacterium]|nr:dTDP-4-dehydrorhamnose reductase [Clostridia bacterium]